MKKFILLSIAVLVFSSHDMFLKLDNFFLPRHTAVTVQLFNGSFDKSENVITRDRMLDVSVVANGKRVRIDTTQWTEQDSMTLLSLQTGAAGTYVAGLSTRARNIEMKADDFNNYLEHDGVLDMVEQRKQQNKLDQDAIEKYSKHVKTIFQVGDERTDDWQTELGYPIEFVPLQNPYTVNVGADLPLKLLRSGQPLANQLVYVGVAGAPHGHTHTHADGTTHHDHDHGAEEEGHHHLDVTKLRTDANGVVKVALTQAGQWYVRTIDLVETEETGLTHESNWATLTFGVKNTNETTADLAENAAGTHTHADGTTHADHDHGGGLPTAIYWLGGLLLAVGIYFFTQRKAE